MNITHITSDIVEIPVRINLGRAEKFLSIRSTVANSFGSSGHARMKHSISCNRSTSAALPNDLCSRSRRSGSLSREAIAPNDSRNDSRLSSCFRREAIPISTGVAP